MEKRTDGSIADYSTTAKIIEDEDEKWMPDAEETDLMRRSALISSSGANWRTIVCIIPPIVCTHMFAKENGGLDIRGG